MCVCVCVCACVTLYVSYTSHLRHVHTQAPVYPRALQAYEHPIVHTRPVCHHRLIWVLTVRAHTVVRPRHERIEPRSQALCFLW